MFGSLFCGVALGVHSGFVVILLGVGGCVLADVWLSVFRVTSSRCG